MLLAHCNTNYVTEEEVLAVPAVEGTDSWKPVSHAEVLASVGKAIDHAGLKVANKTYSLSPSGHRMFGVWELDRVDGDMAYTVGIRNSMDKSMAFGIVAGTKVFVCDNLAFSGEYIRFRKHTKGIVEELEELCQQAVMVLIAKLKSFADWHKRLVTYVLRRRQAEVLTFRAMEMGVINPSQFGAFYALYFEEGAKYRKPDLYHWHEAVTELNKGINPLRLVERNRRLNQICNEFIARYGQRL